MRTQLSNCLVKDFCIENKIICLKLGKYESIINSELKHQVIDSFTAYQELNMYISDTLSFSHSELVEIEDKYRIEKHGFDKYSFRKLPTKKK